MENKKERKNRAVHKIYVGNIKKNVEETSYSNDEKFVLESFATRLNKELEEQNIKQEDFADTINISEGALSNYRNGTRFPQANTLFKMAKELDCSTDYLLGLSELKSSKREIKCVNAVTGLLDDQTKFLEDMKNNNPEYTYILNLLLNPKKNPYIIKLLKAYRDYLLKLNKIETAVNEEYNYINIDKQDIIREYERNNLINDPKEAEYVDLFKITEIAKEMAKKLKELNKEV